MANKTRVKATTSLSNPLCPLFRSRLLGNFVEAAKDLRLACKIDFDEQADEWLKEVTPNVSSSHFPVTVHSRVRMWNDPRA